jgi:hypothetical protein
MAAGRGIYFGVEVYYGSMAGRFDPLENYGVTVAPSNGRTMNYSFLMREKEHNQLNSFIILY